MIEKFYNNILFEISNGRVNCGIMYNVLFETKVEDKILYKSKLKNKNLFIPTLIINDKQKFDMALLKYFYKARNFYEKQEDISKDKSILTLLFNNMTVEDFNNPVNYINRYTNFLDNFSDFSHEINIGYNEILDSDIIIEIKKEPIYEETPYGLHIKCVKDNLYYNFPVVRLGISDNKAYIYAVQHKKDKEVDEQTLKYQKKIHRTLFEVNDGFTPEAEIDNIVNPENITGISPSALVSLTIALSYLESQGISNVVVPTMLPVRYNAKEISYIIRINMLKGRGSDIESLNDMLHKLQDNHDAIQRNLSDKFLRYFRRLEYSFDNINISSLPYELDSYTHINVGEFTKCNNKLLDSIYQMAKNVETRKNK